MVLSITARVKQSLKVILAGSLVVPALSMAAVTYTYDTRHRLTSTSYENQVDISFTYDSVGNRLTKTTSGPSYTIYEDAEDSAIDGWDIYDNDPAGATITNEFDTNRQSRVIRLNGTGTANGYRLRNSDSTYWDDTAASIIEWSMSYSESYVVYIAAQTKDGFRYIYYTPSNSDNLGTGTYIHHGLGSDSRNGSWQTFIRDLEYDLKDAQPNNELEAILGFLIRGTGSVDDIRTRTSLPPSLDSDLDTLSDIDEIYTYGTNPYSSDSDSDGLSDSEELTYWGSNWNSDSDGDGIINLIDPDSDNDGMVDGLEISQGTDPADNSSYPTAIVYEDGENGTISGWDIYDNDPAGALIENVYDDDRGSRVVSFTGSATANGYRLRDDTNQYWNDTHFKNLQWSMKYDENYVVYIAVQTTEGFRYLTYTPVDHDNLGEETYIHHGLGAVSANGTWQTFIRNLEYDLKEAQPENDLEAILGFLIRGSGMVDDIISLETLPEELDSDGDGISDNLEIGTYGTHPYQPDSDYDDLDDNAELTYWGSNWNQDVDSDGIINLIDSDSDNDGFNDGMEISQGTNPADSASYPTNILYEDGEDNTTNGWDIYDNDPAGATLTNVFDDDRNSRVIEFSGAATSNGYRLRNNDFSYWYDSSFKVIEWSMRYSEAYIVYIAAQTKDGFRYIYYTPAETDNLGTETYVHHGLGSQTTDGSWQTITRDLESDLKEAQPDNELEAVLGFLIRGSGRVDDIRTRESLVQPSAP